MNLSRPDRVTQGEGFRLGDVDPADTVDLASGDAARALTATARKALAAARRELARE
jgi:hypothetical protein